MAKMAKILKAFAESKEAVLMIIPELGPILATIEGLDDDVVTVKPEGYPRMIMHVASAMIQRD
ncbi:MAG: hypothetical protein AABZ34_02795 [Nitrospirota bacterium]